MKHTLLIALTLSLSLFAFGCSGDEPAGDAPAAAEDHSGHDHAAHTADAPMASPEEIAAAVTALPAGTWYCPMHPEEKADAKDRCSKCNMYYVQKPAAEAPAADPHAGHNH
jgi:hypothetical protein